MIEAPITLGFDETARIETERLINVHRLLQEGRPLDVAPWKLGTRTVIQFRNPYSRIGEHLTSVISKTEQVTTGNYSSIPTVETNSWETTMTGDPMEPQTIAAELPPFIFENYGKAHGLRLRIHRDIQSLLAGHTPSREVKFPIPRNYTCDFEYPGTRELVLRRVRAKGELDLIIDSGNPRAIGIPAGRGIFRIASVQTTRSVTLEHMRSSTYLEDDPPTLPVPNLTIEEVLSRTPAFLAEYFPGTEDAPINVYESAYGRQMVKAQPYATLRLKKGLLVYQSRRP